MRLGGRAVSSSPCQCGALRNSCGLTRLNANDVCCFSVDFLVQQQEEACFQGLTSHLSFCFCGLPALAFACPSSGLGWGCRSHNSGGRSSRCVPWAPLGASGVPAVGPGAQAAWWIDFSGKHSRTQIPVSLPIQMLRRLPCYPEKPAGPQSMSVTLKNQGPPWSLALQGVNFP